MKKIVIAAIVALAIMGCFKLEDNLSPNSPPNAGVLFYEKLDLGVYDDGMVILALDKISTQMIFTYGDTNTLCLLKDDRSQRVTIKYNCSDPLTTIGSVIKIDIESSGLDRVSSGCKNVEVIKSKDSYVWLWDASEEIGYVLVTDHRDI